MKQDKQVETVDVKKANEVLDLLSRVKSIRWTDILGGISRAFVIIISIAFFVFILNPKPVIGYYLDIQEHIQKDRHTELIEKRVQNTPLINSYLDALRVETGAEFNRAYIMEFHNGNNSMAGLPFYWGDMTYESTDNDILGIRDNWYNISLTRYEFIINAFRHGYFIGDFESVKKIDQKFSYKLKEDHITYIGVLPIMDTNGTIIGAIGISSDKDFDPESINKAKIAEALHRYDTLILPLLLGRK